MVAAVFAVFTLSSGAWAQSANPAAAVVNGETIPMADVEMVLKNSGPPPTTPLTQEQRRHRQLEALSMLIDDVLMAQFLQQSGPAIAKAEVDKQIAELEANLKKDNHTIQDFYKQSGQTEAELRDALTKMLQWAAYAKAHHTDADLKRYYEEFKDFFDRIEVRASHIVLRLDQNATEAAREEARKKLLDLRQEIVSGKLDFAEAAKQHSQCPTAPNGGDIGFFTRKWMLDEEFAKTAFSLKVGEVSQVVPTQFGLHLIKVTDRKAGQPSDFEKIKEEVREFYVEEMRLNILADQQKKAKIQINIP
jgi:parvulin-like peptidyl-prolyl isomerase